MPGKNRGVRIYFARHPAYKIRMPQLADLTAAVAAGKRTDTVRLTQELLATGLPPQDIVERGLVPGMAIVGEQFKRNEIFVPEMLVAARAMTAALGVLKPHLLEEGVEAAGTVAIGTVQGDLHDIGKNLVAMMLEGSGFEIMDLGVDVPAERFVQAVREGANVVAMSALLTTTMTNMREIIQAITDAGLRDQASIVIGGAPITKTYADEIGADGYATDASGAVRVVREVLAA